MNKISDPITQVRNSVSLPDVSDFDVLRLGEEIDRTGFAVIPSFIDAATLASLRELVVRIIDRNAGEYAVLTGKAEISNTLLDQIGADPKFLSLMHRMFRAESGRPAPRQSLYQVLRCLKGTTGLRQAYFFHYDSYVVTALLPIFIPEEGLSGDLFMKPNIRKVRSAYFLNLIDKVLVDNKFSQKRFREQAKSESGPFKRVRIEPGNLYLFWGYRSLHANEPCDPKLIRATALFHYGDPHADSKLRKYTGRAKVRATPNAGPESR